MAQLSAVIKVFCWIIGPKSGKTEIREGYSVRRLSI